MVRVDTAATRRYLKYSTSLVMIKKEKLALLLSFWCQAHLGLKYFVPRHKLGIMDWAHRAWETTEKWEWGLFSLRAIAPRADRGELSWSENFFSTFWNYNKVLAIAWRWGSFYAVVLYAIRCWCASATDWCWYFHPYHILKLDPIWNSEMFLRNYHCPKFFFCTFEITIRF